MRILYECTNKFKFYGGAEKKRFDLSGIKLSNYIPYICLLPIIGVLFEVYNQLGSGYHEKYYQKAVAIELKNDSLSFQREVYAPLIFKGKNIETC